MSVNYLFILSIFSSVYKEGLSTPLSADHGCLYHGGMVVCYYCSQPTLFKHLGHPDSSSALILACSASDSVLEAERVGDVCPLSPCPVPCPL